MSRNYPQGLCQGQALWIRAYMWHSLAAANDDARPFFTRNYLSNQMTPEQIAEGKRQAAEWKPGDCGAEDRTAKSTK